MKTILIRVAQIALAFALLSTIVAFCSTEANAMRHGKAPKRHRVTVAVAFPPSKIALLAQNTAIDELGLTRYRNDVGVQNAVASGDLVSITWVAVTFTAPPKERFLRPQAAIELQGLAMAYLSQFNTPLILTSATRSQAYQRHLGRWNRNAAPSTGPLASSHMAGTTFDVSRRFMSHEQTLWTEQYLRGLGDGVIVEEESGQMCFHIFVRG